MNNSIVSVINTVRRSPSLYIGEHSITRFKAFLDGYIFAQEEAGNEIADFEMLNIFQKKVSQKYSLTTTHGWDRILLFFAGSEGDALNLFWTLWDSTFLDT